MAKQDMNKIYDGFQGPDDEIEELNIVCIDPDDDRIKSLLPQVLGERYIFGVVAKELTDDLKGIVSLSESVLGTDTLMIDYLFVKPQYRGQGVGNALIKVARQFCREIGFSAIFCKVIEEKNVLDDINRFLIKERFYPTNLSGQALVYDINSIRESRFNRALEKGHKDSQIHKLKDISPFVLKEICKKYGLDEKAINLDISVAKLEDEKLVGFAIAGVHNHRLMVLGIDVLSPNTDESLYKKLLIWVIRKCISLKYESIEFFVDDHILERELLSYAISPRIKLGIHEYIKPINNIKM